MPIHSERPSALLAPNIIQFLFGRPAPASTPWNVLPRSPVLWSALRSVRHRLNLDSVGVLRTVLAGCWMLSAQSAAPPDFNRDIRPLLEKRCISCHGRLKQKGDLRLDVGALVRHGGKHGVVVKPGQSSQSRLLERLQSTDPEERMPPDGKPLEPEQIALLAAWIDAGAAVPTDEVIPVGPAEHWSFQPIRRPTVPPLPTSAWPRTPVDHFILNQLVTHGLAPTEDASPVALLRRIHLDLIGLPPTLTEQAAFARNPSPAALETVINDLLERPEYGERWARHWLDWVRYADSNGYERDAAKPLVWQYRDYVIRSLNSDKPYDRFLLEQIAGDELPDATAETLIATGFYRLGHWDDEPSDPATDRYDQLDDLVRTTSEVFLGLTLGCARCHDHKFEPLSTRDYYSLLAVFEPLRRPQNGRTELTLPAGSRAEMAAIAARDQELEELDREITAARLRFREEYFNSGRTHLPAESLAAWQTADAQRSANQKKLVESSAKSLEVELAAAQPEPLRQQLAEWDQRRKVLRLATPDLAQGYFLYEPAGTPPPISHILLRGNAIRPGEEVQPALPAILAKSAEEFPTPDARSSRRRLGLARWLAAPENPLTPRVLVNRIWQQHFGAGLVRTPGDFGLMGEAPTDPELLDWLTYWFVHEAHGSLKQLHRLLLTSHAWRLSRVMPAATAAADPENRLWSYVPFRRLEVEALRDSMLAVSGQLNSKHFGPPMYPSIPAQALEANTDKESIWKASDENEQSRRTIYAFIKRGLVVPLLEVLDLCDTVQSAPRRQVTTVAPQALTLFNGDFVNQQAKHFAARLRREAGPEPARQIELAYRLALTRPPRSDETMTMLNFLRHEADATRAESNPTAPNEAAEDRALIQFARVVLNLNEFVYPD